MIRVVDLLLDLQLDCSLVTARLVSSECFPSEVYQARNFLSRLGLKLAWIELNHLETKLSSLSISPLTITGPKGLCVKTMI